MSSREHLLKIAIDAAEAANKGWDPRADSLTQHTAEAVLNALMPQIRYPKQLLGVPENSLLIDGNGDDCWRWKQDRLRSLDDGYGMAAGDVINENGPLTVIFMP